MLLVIDIGKVINLKTELDNISSIVLDYGLDNIDDEDLDFLEETEKALQDDDFEEHFNFLEHQAEEDEALLRELLGEDVE